jgi:hypothetical protein
MVLSSFSEPLSPSSLPSSSDTAAVSVYSASDMLAPAHIPSSISTAITTTTTTINFSATIATNVDVNQNQRGLCMYLFIRICNFHYCENYEPQKTVFFLIVSTESIRKYVCRVYHQLSQYLLMAWGLLMESSKRICPESFFFSIISQFLCIVHTYFVPGGVAIYR